MRLNGKRAMITAAASGMGRAGALKFAAEGARVVLVDRDIDAARTCAKRIETEGGTADAIQADLTSMDASRDIVSEASSLMGGIDIVWNHVGHPGPSKVHGVDQSLLDLAIDLNLRTVIATTDAAIPHLSSGDGPSILFTASSAGIVGSRYSPVYTAMKHAVVGFAKGLALQLASEGIRSNVVCPGPIETPMFQAFGNRPDMPRRSPEEVVSGTRGIVPLGRLGTPEEVANAAAFLVSDEAAYITGAVLAVDGGFTTG